MRPRQQFMTTFLMHRLPRLSPLVQRLTMSSSSAPSLLAFHLALIQLGQIGADKAKNLQHAREMILKAAGGEDGKHPKADLVVLPVRIAETVAVEISLCLF